MAFPELARLSVAYLSGCYAVPLTYLQVGGKVSQTLKTK